MTVGPKSFYPLAAGLLFCLWFALGSRGLNEPDEGRYANMALEILEDEGHGFLDPVLSDVHHYDKPPMIYWATALSVRAFGENEWALRLPSVLGAMLALTGLAWTAWRLYGAAVAWWALLIGGTLAQFWALARWLTPDMLLTGWVTLAVACWAECRHRRGAWRWWLASLACWTLAWWTKATPALIPLLALYAALWITGDRDGRRALRLARLLPLVILLGSPWYLLMMDEHHDLVSFFFGRELVGRVSGHVDGRQGPWYYYLLVSSLAWLPWWPWCLAAVWRRNRRGWWRRSPETWLVLLGLAVFSLASSKLPTYTLTLAPWAALAMARIIAPIAAQNAVFRRAAAAAAAVWMALALSAALAATRYEAALGRNSSLRGVAEYLRAQGAEKIFADSYWPSLEVYFGEEVYYITGRDLTQSLADEQAGARNAHFVKPEDFTRGGTAFRAKGSWLLHYRRQRFHPMPDAQAARRFGDFDLIPLAGGDGRRQRPSAAAPASPAASGTGACPP